MYIEFNIPHDWDWKHTGYVEKLKLYIHLWTEQHNIKYRTKQVKSVLRMTFDDDKYYTLFTLTWDKGISFRLITDLNNK